MRCHPAGRPGHDHLVRQLGGCADIAQRLADLKRTVPALRLYAVVDGAQYLGQRSRPLTPAAALRPLFAGTPDAALAHAGPWLVDINQADPALIADPSALEAIAPALVWLIAAQPLDALMPLLQLNLDVQLPDGRMALLRFWDPRVLVSLATVLDEQQRVTLFGHVHEWHALHEGQRVWIGRPHARAQ